jgi:hypothetical protein
MQEGLRSRLRLGALALCAAIVSASALTINLNPGARYQRIVGFGARRSVPRAMPTIS